MRDDDRTPPKKDRDGTGLPWWAEDAPQETPLPEGFPERPDGAKLDALRQRVKQDQAGRKDPHRTPLHDRLGKDAGKSARDIGNYTLIPMMMVAGPMIGFLAGHWIERRFGGEPWGGVVGVLFGLAAAVQQIIQMLGRKDGRPRE
ncbi:MAG TPA: AtpZ/AtpI family protein [Candidatus Krumholzibacteria bacterium]|nr:AtpZ/AtpI family protein [Candidatus Krumholzibacteria bacterium]